MARDLVCCIVFPAVLNKVWFFTTAPLIGNIPDLRCFPRDGWACWRILEDLYCHEEIKIVNFFLCCLSFVCTSPLAVITVARLLDSLTVSCSAKFRSFLLSMCIDVSELQKIVSPQDTKYVSERTMRHHVSLHKSSQYHVTRTGAARPWKTCTVTATTTT